MPAIRMDDPEDIAAWNTRASATGAAPQGVWVPLEITKEMAHALESNFAVCLPPSEVHRANWAEAYRNMLAAAPPHTTKEVDHG